MKSTCLLILASVMACNLTVSRGQSIPAEDELEPGTLDDILLERAESLLLRSILKKMRDEDATNNGAEWVTKRQHPGKRYREDLEKRQHPGRRDEDEDEDEDEQYLDVQRRQHPGKRSTMGHVSENPGILPSELSKRQHPGKRYLVLHSKRQHPGKRQGGDEDGGWGADGDEDLPELEKRQHPGKRFWDRSNPDLATNSPCDVLDPTSCSKSDLLFDFLDINKSHGEHKRQHPGKRLAPEDESVEGE